MRIHTTLDIILLRVMDRLRAEVPEATEVNTYLSTQPHELPPNPDEIMFEVSPSSNANFSMEQLTGAGINDVHTEMQTIVTIWVTAQLDQVGHDLEFLTNINRGAIRRIGNVLRALSDHDLSLSDDATTTQILAHPLEPVNMFVPPKDERKRGVVSLAFRTDFDWDMGVLPADHAIKLADG